jgi:hypothetical protein
VSKRPRQRRLGDAVELVLELAESERATLQGVDGKHKPSVGDCRKRHEGRARSGEDIWTFELFV